MIDISCLGCKRSRVQISAARPNSSKSYRYQPCLDPRSGVQLESKRRRRRLLSRAPEEDCSNSWHLSHPRKTCHSRHFQPKLLILFVKLMSGSFEKPDIDPTFRTKKQTFGCRNEADTSTRHYGTEGLARELNT